jgi:hypothetical protein
LNEKKNLLFVDICFFFSLFSLSISLSLFLFFFSNRDMPSPAVYSYYDLVNQVNDLEKQADEIYSHAVNVSDTEQSILIDQENVLRILEREKRRLEDEESKSGVVAMRHMQERAAELNRSYVARNYAFINIVFTVAVVLVMILTVLLIRLRNPDRMPKTLANILNILIFGIGIIYIGTQVVAFNSRDPGNFLKMRQPRPPDSSGEGSGTGTGWGGSSLDAAWCANSDCCSEGTQFDPTKGVCVSSDSVIGVVPVSVESFGSFLLRV